MDFLSIKKAYVLGISMVGMIAQEMAIKHPERIIKLILGCTYGCHNKASNGMTLEMEEAVKLPIRGTTSRIMDLAISKFLLEDSYSPSYEDSMQTHGRVEERGS